MEHKHIYPKLKTTNNLIFQRCRCHTHNIRPKLNKHTTNTQRIQQITTNDKIYYRKRTARSNQLPRYHNISKRKHLKFSVYIGILQRPIS
jgi:hypothetical protein